MKEISKNHPNLKGLLFLLLIVFIAIIGFVVFKSGNFGDKQLGSDQTATGEESEAQRQLRELDELRKNPDGSMPAPPTEEEVKQQLSDLEKIRSTQPKGEQVDANKQLEELEVLRTQQE